MELLTVAEVARELRVHRLTTYNWIRAGLLPARRLPTGRLRVARADLDQFGEGRRHQSTGTSEYESRVVVGNDEED